MSKIEPSIGYGAPRGWKAKQEHAKRKMAGGRNSEERQLVREIRKRHREAIESGEELEAPQAPLEPEPDVAPPEPVEPESEPDADSEGESLPDPSDMDRDALIAELEAAGERVHPASKDATLRRKVRGARNG